MRAAIIGTGLQCGRRAPVILNRRDDTLVAVCGTNPEATQAMARRFACEWSLDWRDIVTRDDVDCVLVCTPPHIHAEISIAAMRNGKDVLCEKPLCRTGAEAKAIMDSVQETGRIFKCGFNHRYHPGIREAKRLADTGELGRLLFGRCRYGLVGRPGYEREWRADPEQAVGGQLGEQGIHALDLFRWFLGDIREISCMTSLQYFTKQPMEDNGMVMLRTAAGTTASVHSSLTQWKNLFSFEVFGEDGYAIVDGLGGSYGTETLTVGRRDFAAPFQHTTTEYRGGDPSWGLEWADFVDAMQARRQPENGSVEDGYQALLATLACYESDRTKRFVNPAELGR